MSIHYLGTGEFAEHIGVTRSTVDSYSRKKILPLPNALIGRSRGWLPHTIDEWNAARPGKRPSKAAADWHVLEHSTIRYLSAGEVAARIGVAVDTLNRYKLPPVDAKIGRDLRGWLPQTIDEWEARRPGKRLPRSQNDWNLPPELQRH